MIGERYADQAFHQTFDSDAAVLNNLSTAAELGSVELIFMNAVASVQWTSSWIGLTNFYTIASRMLLVL